MTTKTRKAPTPALLARNWDASMRMNDELVKAEDLLRRIAANLQARRDDAFYEGRVSWGQHGDVAKTACELEEIATFLGA
jgi:hypothetical protein